MANHGLLTVTLLNSPYSIATGGNETYTGITVLAGELDVSGAGTNVSTVALVEAVGSTINVTNNGTFDIEGIGAQGLSGAINVGSGGTVIEGSNLSVIAPVNFTDNTGTLFLNQNNLLNLSLLSPITGFQFGDKIEINETVTSASYDASTQTLTLFDNGSAVANLNVTGPSLTSSSSFIINHDSSGNYSVTVACFLPGTRVLTEDGGKPIEEVKIGDRLMTQSGVVKPVKWVGRRSYPAAVAQESRHVTPILIRQGALDGTLPRRDLYLSPCHAMYLDGMLIKAEDLVNGVSVLRTRPDADITYWNVEFDGHEVIFAEGAATESFGCQGSRKMYDNWQEYDALYPGELAQRKPFFAPRRDCGAEVEAVRRRIDRLAGIERPQAAAAGALLGWIETMDHTMVRGWAANAGQQDEPVVLDVVLDGQLIGEVTANHMRQGRLEAGHPTGRCGFQFRLPAGLSPFERHVVRIRRAADGVELSGSPALLEAAVRLDADGQRELGSALTRAATLSAEDMDRTLQMLLRQADILLQARADLAGRRAEVTKPSAEFGWSAPIPRVANEPHRAAA